MRNRRCAPPVRTASFPLIALGVALALAAGCEPREGGVDADLTAAIEFVELAGAGYVPSDYADEFDPVDVASFRQHMLAQAADRLEAVARTGDSDQRFAARDVLADIHTSAAHHLAGEAGTAAAALAGDVRELRAQLRRVTVAHTRVRLLGQDRSAIEQELRAQTREKRQQREGLESLHADLEEELAELEARRDEYRAEARAARSEQHRVHNDAYALPSGEEQHALLAEAAAAERAAAEADAEADLLEASIERRSAERDAAASEIETIDALLEDMANQLEKWAEGEQARGEERGRAEARHREAGEALTARFDTAADRYEAEVHQRFAAARERIDEAVELLEQSADQARGDDRQAAQRKLLAARAAAVRLATDHAVATAIFGRAMAMLMDRGPEVLPDDAELAAIEQVYDRLAERLRETTAAGIDAAQVGQALATELGNVDDPDLQSYADRQRTSFARHMQTLEEQTLQ